MTIEAAIKTFFSAPRFAVAGASSDPRKFGHKVLLWYLERNLQVTPINPSSPTITFPNNQKREPLSTAPTIKALGADATSTALSVITPPKVTRQVLEEARESGIQAVWLQPGSFDEDIWTWAKTQWPDAAVAGFDRDEEANFGTVGGEGWCVLVDGDRAIELSGRNSKL